MTTPEKRGRGKLVLLAALFTAPLLLAVWLYYSDSALRPGGRSNFGTLLEPIVNVNVNAGDETNLTALTDGAAEGRWALIYVNEGGCAESCRNMLHRLRQTRLMLGNDMQRLVRIFLHGEIGPDRVWLEEQHAGLITIRNERLAGLLIGKRPDDRDVSGQNNGTSDSGGLFLVDPFGNLVMHFAADLVPGDMVSDIEHLLELSRIG